MINVVLVAEEAAGVQALRLAHAHPDVTVVAVLSAEDPGRGTTVATVAERLGVPRRDPAAVRDRAFAAWLVDQRIDVLLNVHSLHVADAAVVAAPTIGSWNLHPGPLPRYAGLNAPSWAIFEGQRRHAVTVHRMAATVDAGAIAFEHWYDIAPTDTGLQVAAAAVRHGLPLLRELLDRAARDPAAIPARAQDQRHRRWYGREVPFDGGLPWTLPAQQIVDLVRAADYTPFRSPWGTPTATLGSHAVAIARATVGEPHDGTAPGTVGPANDRGVSVAAADRWVTVERLRWDGVATDPVAVLTAGSRFACKPAPVEG